jgi:hypothetical protein
LVLVVIQVVIFGINYPKVGFYLDDWNMLSELTFGPHNPFSLLAMYFFDGRVSIRPIEALYFPCLFLLFGVKSMLWHLFIGSMEIAAAWFLFLSLRQLKLDPVLAFIGSILFLINPCRDSTHYWVTCSSTTCSFVLYLLSLWLCIKALGIKLQKKRRFYQLFSAAVFAGSVFNYESTMFLFVLQLWYVAVCSYREYGGEKKLTHAFSMAGKYSLLYIPTIVLMVAYERLLWPLFKLGNNRSIVFDFHKALDILRGGFDCVLGPCMVSFLNQQAWTGITTFRLETLIILLSVLTGTTILGAVLVRFLFRNSAITENATPCIWSIANSFAWLLLFPGVICIALSYSIFAIAVVYQPTLLTAVDRINTGATIGSTLIALYVLVLIWTVFHKLLHNNVISNFMVLLSVSCLLVYFALADWGYAQPWMRSAIQQKRVQKLLLVHAGEIPRRGSLLLAGSPRYDMWAPVFDGVWDFESMSRIVLHDPSLNANVVSDRLVLGRNVIKDVSMNFVCGTYPLPNLKVLIASTDSLHTVNSPAEFVALIKPYYEISQVPPQVFHRWTSFAGSIHQDKQLGLP